MHKAIITLTKGGLRLGLKLHREMDDSVLYVHRKFEIEGRGIQKIHGPMTEFVGKIFHQYQCLIFIMAAGIVVRTIAPHIQDKKWDPAVIVLDEKGKNVISLLSGHMGRANGYTLEIAQLLGANPVITTASDVNEKIAVDTLAMALDCSIENFRDATRVTAHIVNGERVGMISHIPVEVDLPENMVLTDEEQAVQEKFAGMIYITEKRIEPKIACDYVVLRPKNIILGVGCKRGKSKEEIMDAILDTLHALGVAEASIKHIATADVKKDEPGLLEAAQALGVPLVSVAREALKAVEDEFEGSDFVRKSIGVGSVCEPAAFLTSSGGIWLQRKTIHDGITIAVIREGGNPYGNHCGRHQL